MERAASWSPVHAYVADHGRPTHRVDIEHISLGGRRVAVAAELTEAERRFVSETIHEIEPVRKACFANSLRLWRYSDCFEYAEGFAIEPATGFGIEHAWCMLDGEKLVDVTAPFEHYYGAVVSDDNILDQHASDPDSSYGVIGNHRNQFAFLRDQGYVSG